MIDIPKYIRLMDEIKNRVASIQSIMNREYSTQFPQTNVEFMYLQLRKIFELIALGTLVANRKEFELQKKKFDKAYHAGDILKSITKVNPDFYPVPLKKIKNPEEGVEDEMIIITSEYLTKDDLIKGHGICGSVLHANNPYKGDFDYFKYAEKIPEYLKKTMTLLNIHKIKLLGHDGFFYVHMRNESNGRPHMTKFDRIDKK